MLTQLLCSAALLTASPDVAEDDSAASSPFEKFAAVLRGQTPGPLYGDPALAAPLYGDPALSGPVYGDPFNNPVIIGGPYGGYEPFGPCCPPFGQHRHGIFGDFLLLSVRGADVQYATPVAGTAPAGGGGGGPPPPGGGGAGGGVRRAVGPSAIVDPGYEPGFRVGGSFALTPESSLTFTYWWYESTTDDGVSLPGGPPGDEQYLYPDLEARSGLLADFAPLSATANYDIEFQNIDFAYRRLIKSGCNYAANYSLGLRYAHLDQDLLVRYFDAPGYGVAGLPISTDIDFEGIGPRVGLDGERMLGSGFSIYGASALSVLVGEVSADYFQAPNTLASRSAYAAGFDDDRIVPQLDLEFGLGWQDSCGHFRVKLGYFIGAWFNMVTTPSFINAVQANNFADVDDTLTFDGMALRVELDL